MNHFIMCQAFRFKPLRIYIYQIIKRIEYFDLLFVKSDHLKIYK